MTTLFISDLHLDEQRPAVTALFLDWLRREATQAEALYILGDMFEAYIGDDDDAPLVAHIADALRAVSDQGVRVCFVHGNRDFLVGDAFATRYRVREVAVVDKGDSRLLDPADSPQLTLITCWPFDAVAPGTPLRYVVIADRFA